MNVHPLYLISNFKSNYFSSALGTHTLFSGLDFAIPDEQYGYGCNLSTSFTERINIKFLFSSAKVMPHKTMPFQHRFIRSEIKSRHK